MQASQTISIRKIGFNLAMALIGSFAVASCASDPTPEQLYTIPDPIDIPTPEETTVDVLPDPVDNLDVTEPVEVVPVVTTIPTAKPVPGRPGFVFNPFTQNMVDVDGIPSSTKVRDPQDSDESHVFKVP